MRVIKNARNLIVVQRVADVQLRSKLEIKLRDR